MSTKPNTEFDLLDPEVVASVPDLHHAPEGEPIRRAADLAQKLESERNRIVGELAYCSDAGPCGPMVRYDASKDAQTLLDGADVATLTAPVEESHRSALLRQLRACEGAAPTARARVGEIEGGIIVEQCQQLAPVAREIIGETLAAAEHLLVCLRAEQQFYDLLNRRGLSEGKRLGWMQLWPQMLGWLNGDIHRPPLAKFITDRAEAAGIEIERSK